MVCAFMVVSLQDIYRILDRLFGTDFTSQWNRTVSYVATYVNFCTLSIGGF